MSRTQTTPMKIWSNWNSHSLLVGIENSTNALKDSLEVSYKTEHTFDMTQQSYSLVFTQMS